MGRILRVFCSEGIGGDENSLSQGLRFKNGGVGTEAQNPTFDFFEAAQM